MALSSRITESRDFASMYYTGLFEPEELDQIDWVRFRTFVTSAFRYYETSYIQYRNGDLDDELWETLAHQLSAATETPGFRKWWKDRENWYSQDFRDLVNRTASIPTEGEALR